MSTDPLRDREIRRAIVALGEGRTRACRPLVVAGTTVQLAPDVAGATKPRKAVARLASNGRWYLWGEPTRGLAHPRTYNRTRGRKAGSPQRVRARTVDLRRMPKGALAALAAEYPAAVNDAHARPRTLADCTPIPQPCPWCGETVVMRVVPDAEEFSLQGPDGSDVRETAGDRAARVDPKRPRDDSDMARPMRVRGGKGGRGKRAAVTEDDKLRRVHETRVVRDAGVCGVGRADSAMHQPAHGELPAVRRSGDHGVRRVEGELSRVPGGHGPAPVAASLDRSHQQRRPLQSGELQVGDADGAGEEQAHVACPECRRRVSYVGGVGGAHGAWVHYSPRANPARLGPEARREYARALNRCEPCAWTACKHHLYLDVNETTGNLRFAQPDKEPWELEHTCALRVAASGGATLEEVGALQGITRERARQIEERTLAKVRRHLPVYSELAPDAAADHWSDVLESGAGWYARGPR